MMYSLKAALGAMALVAMLGASARADEKEAAMEKELKLLEGSWQCTREEGNGRLTPEIITKGFHIIIEGTKYQHIYGGKEKGSTATILKIDSKASPKTIDMEWTSGSWKDQKYLGIYKLAGDKLEICWAEVGSKKRPKKFTTAPGVGVGNNYVKYTREKD